MQVYNTLTRKKEEFQPLHDKKVGLYTCGPTVYNYAHIGNLRSFIFADLLKRTLRYLGYDVTHVMNITDVGHLTDDADDGEDKMEKGARREGKSVWDVAEYYTEAFKRDIEALDIEEPDVWCKATDHIQEQIAQIKAIEEKGYTYTTSDGVYFDTSKLDSYGELARLKPEDLEGGKRVDLGEKRNKTDFALWKFSPENEKRQMEWDSPWGVGFPGWHIECSAMATEQLGKQFDIHTGGIDHIPVHHTNEIAQAETALDVHPWVRYWMHGEFLVLDKEKMAKSGENFITLSVLQEKGYDPLHYRYLCLTAHYRQQLTFTWDALEGAKQSYKRLKNIIGELDGDETASEEYVKQFAEASSDDLNMPRALALLWEALRDDNLSPGEKRATAAEFDTVLGLDLLTEEKVEIPEAIKKLADEREDARKNKDFATADKIRDELRENGWQVDDADDGPRLKPAD